MKEVQKDKKSYNVPAVIKRMLEHMAKQDKAQFGRIFLYTLLAGIYPFFAVLLPKIAIGILEQGGETAGKTLCISMAVYFLLAGSCIVLVSYLQGVINARNMRTRLLYLGDLGRKLMKMDYCHYSCCDKLILEFELILCRNAHCRTQRHKVSRHKWRASE